MARGYRRWWAAATIGSLVGWVLFAALAMVVAVQSAHAQSSFTAVGGGGVPGMVPMSCNANGANCRPSGTQTAGGVGTAQCVDSAGVLCAAKAGTADRTITKTSVSATTSTSICPAVTTPVVTEIQVSAGPVGLGLNGQTLTGAALGATSADADVVLPSASTLYTLPVAATNAITAYSAGAFVASCIQTKRQ